MRKLEFWKLKNWNFGNWELILENGNLKNYLKIGF